MLWFKRLRRLRFLRNLAREELGQIAVGNLLSALEDRIIPRTLSHAWLDKAARSKPSPTYFDTAFAAIKSDAANLQFKGATASFAAGSYLVALRQVAGVRAAIESQQPDGVPGSFTVPTTDEDMPVFLVEQREMARRRLASGTGGPVLEIFNRRYPAWYAQREGDFDLLLERARLAADQDDDTGPLLRVLRFLGLPLQPYQMWMVVVFRPHAPPALHRPTVFEGFDGPFFKQKPLTLVDGNWGATTDLHPRDDGLFVLQDGAVEAVGRTMTVLDIVDSFVFPPLPIDISPTDEELRVHYSRELLAFVAPLSSSWLSVAGRIAGFR